MKMFPAVQKDGTGGVCVAVPQHLEQKGLLNILKF